MRLMQILGSVLPGLREIRAPIVAGYLWLVLAWILIGQDLDTRPHDGVLASFYDLGHEVGRLGVAVAVGVVAYLVGAVSQSVGEIIPSVAASDRSGVRRLLRPFDFFLRPVPRVEMRPIERIDRAVAEARRAVERAGPNLRPEQITRLRSEAYNELDDRSDLALLDARSELRLPATALLSDKPELFGEVDRLRAEGELRLAVVPPLIALTIAMSVVHNWYWIVALAPIALLLREGLIRADQSRREISDAIARGYVDSTSQADFESWVQRFVDETLPAMVAREAAVFDIVVARWRSPSRSIDVTERLRRLIVDDKLHVVASSEAFGEDPDEGVPKQLEITFRVGGGQFGMTYDEGTDVRLPPPET
jgi:hypothetical protein